MRKINEFKPNVIELNKKNYNIFLDGKQLNKKEMSWSNAQQFQDDYIRKYGVCPNIKVHRN